MLCQNCNTPMEIRYDDENHFCCPQCGLLIDRDESYTYGRSGFNSYKHFAESLNHILGKTAPKENVNIQGDDMTVKKLREILKSLKLSKYYKYTSYFMRELGFSPPDIPESYIWRASFMFQEYINLREQCREHFGPNNPSYSYLIYKIFDEILPSDDAENRRIFQFIVLPGKKTLEKRNKEWDIIWKQNMLNNQLSIDQ